MPEPIIHIATAGENWASIAFRYWGKTVDNAELNMHVLIAANPLLAHICVFDGGERILVPQIDDSDKTNLPPWKQ